MIVLDTYVLLWWINGSKKISAPASKLIEKAKITNSIYISSISTWEIAMLIKYNRIVISIPLAEWIKKIEKLPFVHFIDIDNDIAEQSVNLPGKFHKDPADRIIIATARHLNMPLLTKDEKILSYKHVKTKW